MKPGVKTSEFWTVLVSAIVLLFAFFKIPIDQANVEGAVTAVGTIVSFVALVISYIKSRTDLKKAQVTTEANKEIAKESGTTANIETKQ